MERPPEDWPRLAFEASPQWFSWALVPVCQALLRRCENTARALTGLPEIGSGWISETELFGLIQQSFPHVTVLRHARPRWLRPQHLDVFIPEWNVAIEYQGKQHYEPVDYFGGEDALRERQRRDRRKRRLCRQNGCTLIEVRKGYDPDGLIARISALIEEGQGTSEQL